MLVDELGKWQGNFLSADSTLVDGDTSVVRYLRGAFACDRVF